MEEIKKNASRERIIEKAEKLGETVSRQATKIIKLKVAQDTAYWDLKEKLQQVGGSHERLQQNMVELQMQHETISGQYQDELRRRPEILNKVSSNRELCDVLEAYGNTLKETLLRCKADHGALSAAFQKSGQEVQELTQRQLKKDDQTQLLIDTLQDKVRVTEEHSAQLLQLLSSTRQQAEAEVRELKHKLETVLGDKEHLTSNVMELKQKLDLCSFDIQKMQETIANLQKEKKELFQEYNIRSADANNTLMKQANELKKATETNDSLKVAINNQERTMCERNNIYQEKLAKLEEEKAISTTVIQDLKDNLQESANMNDLQKNEIGRLIKEKEHLSKEISQQEALLLSYKEDINKLNEQISTIEEEKREIITNLNKTTEQLSEKLKNIEELTANTDNLQKKLTAIENEHKVNRESSEEQIKDLMKVIEARNKELDSKAGTITHLMSELKIGTDVRSKLETALQKVQKEIEIERDHVNKNTIKFENEIQCKEEELSKQMTIILDMKNEKDRLQKKIQDMQNKIDNIQIELTRPPKRALAPMLQADLDDNAVTPPHEGFIPCSSIIQKNVEQQQAASAAPRNDSKIEDVLFNLFSDSSADKTLDATEVNRRFVAISRGEPVSPLPLRMLKRRGAGPLRANKRTRNDDAMSQPQIKNIINKGPRFFKNKHSENKTQNNK